MRILLVSLLAPITVFGLLMWGYHEYQGARASFQTAREDIGQVQSTLRQVDTFDVSSMAAACQKLRDANAALADLVARVDRLRPLVVLVQNVPGLATQASVAEALVMAGNLTAESAGMLCEGLEPLQSVVAASGSMESAVQALAQGQPRFETALARLRAANEHLGQLKDQQELERLGPEAKAATRALREAVPRLQLAAGLLVVTPRLLGADQERTYLVLSQNSDELRPTGGFVGTAGTLDIRNGRIVRLEYGASSQYDTPSDERVPPPAPLARYLDTTYWHLRDSNWWPDFRASAEQALYFYGLRNQQLPDGVIALDQETVRRLLEVIGPVFVPEFNETVGAENLDERLEYHVHAYLRENGPITSGAERKAFVAELSRALLRRLVGLPSNQLPAVAKALGTAVEDKHLLVYMRDPALASALGRANWDGAMLQAPSDYLLIANANVSANKVNRYVQTSGSYSVAAEGGAAIGTLRYTLENTHPAGEAGSEQRSLYRDYLRVYAPAGSTLLSSDGFDHGPVAEAECGKASFAGMVELPAGSVRTITLRYRLPVEVARDLEAGRYSLVLQHQAGSRAVRWDLAVAGHATRERIAEDRFIHLSSERLEFAGSALLRHFVPAGERSSCEIMRPTPAPLAAPVRLRIPSVGVDAEIVDLGVTPDGMMEAPETGEVVGWYASSARPGWPGNVVMSGHVDWESKAAVFFDLRKLERGDEIEVVAENGRTYRYRVAENEDFPVDGAPIVRVVGPTARMALTLITCDGPFDPQRGEYLHRRAVRAYLAESSSIDLETLEERRGEP